MNIDITHEYCFIISLSLQEHKLASPQASPVFTFHLCSQYYTERKTGEKWGRSGSIHHVNDVRWTWGRHGREGVQLPKQHTGSSVQMLYHSFGLQTLAWMKLLVTTGKKLTFKFSTYIFEYWPLPTYIHLVSTHVMNAPRPSLFFAAFRSHILLWIQKVKTRGGLGMRLVRAFLLYKFNLSL